MQFLEYDNLVSAQNRSRTAMESRRNRTKLDADVTEYLYAWVPHPSNGKYALCIPDEATYTQHLTAQELTDRKSQATMESNGWEF